MAYVNTEDISELLRSPVLLSVIAGLLAVLYIWRQQHHICNYPAGPFNFPIVGNLPQLVYSGSMAQFLNGSKKKYGDVFTITLGGYRRVVVLGYENIYQLLVKKADFTSNRHPGSLPGDTEKSAIERPGLVWAPFPHWKTLRNFALKMMREEGMGKASLEPKIHHEINMFCKHFIEPKLGKPYDLSNDMAKVTLNIISEMIFGGRSDYDDPDFSKLISAFTTSIQSGFIRRIVKNLPVIRYITQSRTVGDGAKFIKRTIEKQIEMRKNNLNPDGPGDIMDEYLIHQMKSSMPDNQHLCFTDGNLFSMATQLYGAGTETTSTALKWAFLFTAYYPDVMKKLQEEIMTEIGFDKEVTAADRGHMPYTDAVLLETLRLASIAPGTLPHLLEKELEIDGKVIPAGSDLMVNLQSVLHDSNVFENPEKFDPDRFLTGDVALKKKRVIPFSLGRRVCLGESLARMELFLIYVTIMQKYNFKLAEDNSFKLRISNKGGLNSPQPYRLVFSHK